LGNSVYTVRLLGGQFVVVTTVAVDIRFVYNEVYPVGLVAKNQKQNPVFYLFVVRRYRFCTDSSVLHQSVSISEL
jgi:hypothetical protein